VAAGHAEGSPAKEDSVGGRCPFVLDPEGRDIHEEVEIGLATLFERFPDVELAVDRLELRPQPTFTMNGYRTVPARIVP
jgi:hypothetical protein